MRLATPVRHVPYNVRQLYSHEDPDRYVLKSLWEEQNVEIDPNYLPYKCIKTALGEFLIKITVFKTPDYFLKLVGDHFVFIHNNQRKVIPICSHSQ